ncbi:hypothetical protein C9426_16860 [Serratia sp. S1B]|nr:hypothetical protein C9426_16860 [Serratia sp. S1B]
MLIKTNEILTKKFITILLTILYLIFFTNLVRDHGESLSLMYIPIVIFLISFFSFRKIYLNQSILITCFSSFIFITLNEFIFHSNQISIDASFDYQANQIIIQFLFILPLILLPTIYNTSNFREKHFFTILAYANILSLLFNLYWNITLNFNRDLLVIKFGSIILYDYCMISISIMSIIYSIKSNKSTSYLFSLASIINILLIIAHGSRGAWIAIPIVFSIIFFNFYKTRLSHLIFITTCFLFLTLTAVLIPNSPIIKRIELLKQDTSEIQKNNYNTSFGARVSLWKFSIAEFHKSPITGIGIKQFRTDTCNLKEAKEMSTCFNHAHNVFFQELVSHGILGLISILLTFLTPLFYFMKSFFTYNESKPIALAGISLIIYTLFCGLSDYLFSTPKPTLFFYFTVITLISIINQTKEKNTNSQEFNY